MYSSTGTENTVYSSTGTEKFPNITLVFSFEIRKNFRPKGVYVFLWNSEIVFSFDIIQFLTRNPNLRSKNPKF